LYLYAKKIGSFPDLFLLDHPIWIFLMALALPATPIFIPRNILPGILTSIEINNTYLQTPIAL
jgi:hypothetical protein